MPLISAEQLLSLLREKQLLLIAVESCTGGKILSGLTSIAGSSDVVWGGFVTYSNESKTKLVGVRESILTEFGAVSGETVSEMLSGALSTSGVDVAVAVSGIAGPGGGSAEKPVGTVWIGVRDRAGKENIKVHHFTGNRIQVQDEAVNVAYQMLGALLAGS